MAQLLKNNLFLRIFSAGIFLALLIIAFINKYSFLIVFEFFMLQSLWEFYNITEKINGKPKKWFGLLFSAFLFIFVFLLKNSLITSSFSYFIVAFAFISFAIELLRKGSALKNLAYEFMGIFYIAIPFTLTNFIVFTNNKFDYSILLGVFVIIWTYDTIAYFVGSAIGKRKIFPDISPKKTLEGTIAGLLFGILSVFLVYKILNVYHLYDWLIMAALIVFGAFTGDLVESKIKRSANVKDSGKIMPGHGGLLDRFDSFLFAIVAVSIYLVFL